MRLNDIPTASGALDGTETMLGLKAGAAVLLSRDVATPQVTGLDPAKLPYAARGLARVRSGAGRMTINVIGNSAVMGKGAGTGSNLTVGARPFSIPTALAKALSAAGLPTRTSSWFGGQGFTVLADLEAYDARQSHTGSAQLPAASPGTLGIAGALHNLNTAGGKKSFLPAEAWDTADLYLATYPGGGTATMDVGGSALETFSTASGSVGLAKRTITAPAAVQALNVNCSVQGATGLYLVGADLYNSAAPDVCIRNLGFDGAQSADFTLAANPFNALPVLAAIQADLTFVCLMRNDQLAGVDPATTAANLQTIITTAKAGGDVILLIDHEPTGALANDAAYTAMLRGLATANAISLLDLPNRIGHAAQATALGLFSADNIHYARRLADGRLVHGLDDPPVGVRRRRRAKPSLALAARRRDQ